ncbi:DUF6105 family protein [Consotaella sp. CSK11QG-6]
MRSLLIFWLAPVGFFWGWYFLSLNDLSFGMFFFSRELHDRVFAVYGAILGVEPAAIPGMVADALFYDSFLVLGLVAFRKRRAIVQWIKQRRGAQDQEPATRDNAASLSNAP